VATQFFATTVEINSEGRGRELQDGITDENSGGNVWFNRRTNLPHISLEAVFQDPVIHGLHGEQPGESCRIVTGLQLLF
jgi:hypothetical protein